LRVICHSVARSGFASNPQPATFSLFNFHPEAVCKSAATALCRAIYLTVVSCLGLRSREGYAAAQAVARYPAGSRIKTRASAGTETPLAYLDFSGVGKESGTAYFTGAWYSRNSHDLSLLRRLKLWSGSRGSSLLLRGPFCILPQFHNWGRE
jgi:hypothetical protein